MYTNTTVQNDTLPFLTVTLVKTCVRLFLFFYNCTRNLSTVYPSGERTIMMPWRLAQNVGHFLCPTQVQSESTLSSGRKATNKTGVDPMACRSYTLSRSKTTKSQRMVAMRGVKTKYYAGRWCSALLLGDAKASCWIRKKKAKPCAVHG